MKGKILKKVQLITAITLAFLTAGSPAFAGKTSIGIKAGINFSNAYGTPEGWDESIDWKSGITGGAFLNYAFNDNFSIQPELLYTQKGFGSALLDETDIIEVDLTVSLDYFELPVLAKYSFSPGKSFRPVLFAGPSFAYCSGSELSVSSWIFSADIDFSSMTHTTDFGLVLGGGFDYALSNGTLVLDARFTWGFTNVILSGDFEIDGSTETIDEDDFKNYGISFMLGYVF
jgi:opacity protein-like surface antigen